MRKNLLREIRKYQKELDLSVEKNGLDSNKIRKLSTKLDELINEYYRNIETIEFHSDSNMTMFFEVSYNALKKVTKEFNKFPNIAEWNKYAKENIYFSSKSIEYISMLDWNYLRIKVLRELNLKII